MKKYYKVLLASILIINMALVFYQSNALGEENKLLFRVNVSSLGLQASSSFVQDKGSNDIVEISLRGELYNPPIEVVEISKDAIDRNSPENATFSFYSANKSGDSEWILDSWAEKDRVEIQNFIESFLEKNTELFHKIDKYYITGRAEYNGYIILFIKKRFLDGRESWIPTTYIETAKGWKVTNDLSADETYDVIFAALRSGEVIPKVK